MLDTLNRDLFQSMNAAPDTSSISIALTTFLAKDLIVLFPITVMVLWLWGREKMLTQQRVFACKTTFALMIGLIVSGSIGVIFPHERPFVVDVGTNFLHHSPSPSFPSNHGTIVFTFAFAFFFWLRKQVGLIMFIPAFLIAWTRVYLGVHWPLDMLGGFILAIAACGLSEFIWRLGASRIFTPIQLLYRKIFQSLIRKGYVKS